MQQKEWFDMFDYGIVIPYPFLLYSSIAPMLIVYFFDISLIHVSFFIFPIGLIVYTGSFISYGIYEKFGSVFIFHIWFLHEKISFENNFVILLFIEQ